MHRIKTYVVWGLVLLGGLLCGSAFGARQDLASALVRDTSDRMLAILQERRADLDRDPSLIYRLVEDIVVPNFDFERITRSAVGRYWRKAGASEREALVTEFRQLLVRTYAKALLNYAGQKIGYLPLRPGHGPEDVTVKTQVSEGGAPPVPIDYSLYLKDGAWKVYDVVIDGVSLVANYRSSFAAEIRRNGIGGLIQALQARNREGSG